MADINQYWGFAKEWEGIVYENDSDDECTKFGIVLQDLIDFYKRSDFTCEDIKNLKEEDALKIFKSLYWDFYKSDEIKSQSVSEAINEFGFNTGKYNSALKVQSLIGTDIDGKFGPNTLSLINGYDSLTLFKKIQTRRKEYYINLVNINPKKQKYLKGWMNRVNALKFKN